MTGRPLRCVPAVLAAVGVLLAGCSDESREEPAAGTVTGASPATGTAMASPGTAAPAATTAVEPAESSFDRIPEIVRRLQPSIVAVLVESPEGEAEGSGVVWSSDGIIVTNNHVVEGASSIEVALASGERVSAEPVATDPRTDLALIRVDRTDLPAATFAPGLPEVGELAIAMGNPLGFENSVTAGIVSAVHRSIPSGGQTPALVDLLQTDAAISPGNSGGALVDGDGNVIGINVAYIPPEASAVAIGFAIPSPTVLSVVPQLLDTGHAEHAYLGVELRDVTPEVAAELDLPVSEGVLVFSVSPGTPADQVGLEPGDVIVALDDEQLRTVEDLLSALRNRSPGDTVQLTVNRDGEELELTPTLTDRPAS